MGVIIRQSIKGTLFTYIGALIGAFSTFYIIPKYLGDELLGLTRVFIETGTLFALIFQLGVSSSAIRFFPQFKTKDGKNNGFFFYLISIATIGFLVFVPVFFLLKEPIANFFLDNASVFNDYIYWLIPLTFFLIYWMTFEVYSNVLMRIAIPKFIREVLIRVLFIAIYILYASGHLNLSGFIIAYVSVYGIAMLTTFFYVSRIGTISLQHDSKFITPALKKDYFSYSSIIILGTLGGSLLSRIDLLMVGSEIGFAAAGVYTIAYNMISFMEMPSRSITSISTPIAAEALKKGNIDEANQLYKKVSAHQLLIGSIVFLLIWINIDNIYSIMPEGDTFKAGKWVVLFMGTAKLIEMTISFGEILIKFSKFYHWSLYFTFIIIGINVSLNWFFIPRWGITGAAIATALASVISYALQQTLILIKIKANPYSKSTVKILLLIIITLCINHFLPELQNPWIDILYRSCIICIFGGCFIYFSKISNEANAIINSVFSKIKNLIKK
ncbi:polysaccharide biosynthesis C-terminal domain-containing protein [Bacteroidales bacterium OttesenSCG-928-M06]|nr:polysaccharide biosynthesis C-terminal domain-containing protein [Bacteroidales bacterium OttesenSCG-928-M06]